MLNLIKNGVFGMPTVENGISCKEKDAVFYTVRENPFDLYGIYIKDIRQAFA